MKKATILLAITLLALYSNLHASVSDHVFEVEISTTYDYGVPGDVTYYEFDAWLHVDDTVVSGTLQTPSSNVYPLELDIDEERWLGLYRASSNLDDLADFNDGIYTFTVNYLGGDSNTTDVNYTLPNGDPIPPVTQVPAFIYPLNEATYVPLSIIFQFEPATDPNITISVGWEPEYETPGALCGEVEDLPYDTSSYGPVMLSPDIYYDIEVIFNHMVRAVNADGIPTVVDKDAECDIFFTTISSDGVSPPYYLPQTVVLADANKEYMFIKDTDKKACWAGEDYGAIDFVAINDNNDNQRILVPSTGFYDQQGVVVGYNVNDESEAGALCALTEYFNLEHSGPGGSGLPVDLNNSTLEVDIDFIVPEDPSVTTLQNGMGFWLEEADGDSFDTDGGVIDLHKGWHTYTYDISNLTPLPYSGTFGDSPVVLLAIEFYDPTDPLGLYKIVYFVDNFRIIGDEMFYEGFEGKCTDILVGDLNNDCIVNFRDLAMIAMSWLQDNSG